MNIKDCKAGMKVKFIDKKTHEEDHWCYPPVGTIGTIIWVTEDDILVRWPEGTTNKPNEWYCDVQCVEEVQENLTDHEIWDMLRAKMEKNGIKVDCFKTVSNVDFPNLRAFNYPLYSKEALIKAVALAYRVGYKRAEKGRPFKYGDKVKKIEKAKKSGHWETVDPNNLPPIGAKLMLARRIGNWNSKVNIGDIYYRTDKNVFAGNPYEELWVTKESENNAHTYCSSEHPERFNWWVED